MEKLESEVQSGFFGTVLSKYVKRANVIRSFLFVI
jgi:hypothetical protein